MKTEAIQSAVGKRCWYVSAGGVTAPSFTLVLGERIPREAPLNNKAHPEAFRQNRGSVELLIWCSWRLQTDLAVLATSDSPQDMSALERLVDSTVTEIKCSPPAWDLNVHFSDGLELVVFCDNFGTDPSASQNWEFWAQGVYVQAGLGEFWKLEHEL